MVALAIDPEPGDASRKPLEAIGLVSPAMHADVRRAIAGLHVTLDLSESTEIVVARIESTCPELLIIDTDLLGCPEDLCRFAHSLRPDVKVFGLAYYWSEREQGLRNCADAILHKPARGAEWKPVLRRFGVRDVNLADNQPRSSLE